MTKAISKHKVTLTVGTLITVIIALGSFTYKVGASQQAMSDRLVLYEEKQRSIAESVDAHLNICEKRDREYIAMFGEVNTNFATVTTNIKWIKEKLETM